MPPDYPYCDVIQDGQVTDCTGCWVYGAETKLYYWPELSSDYLRPSNVSTASECPNDLAGILAPTPTKTQTYDGPPLTTVLYYSNEMVSTNVVSTTTLTYPTAYMSIDALEGRDACNGFDGAPIAGTIIPVKIEDLSSGLLQFPGITNAAQSTRVASLIANRQTEQWHEFLGIGWESTVGISMTQTVPVNMADFGKPPSALAYYFGAVGLRCIVDQYISGVSNKNTDGSMYIFGAAGLLVEIPPGMPCDTIYDGEP